VPRRCQVPAGADKRIWPILRRKWLLGAKFVDEVKGADHVAVAFILGGDSNAVVSTSSTSRGQSLTGRRP